MRQFRRVRAGATRLGVLGSAAVALVAMSTAAVPAHAATVSPNPFAPSYLHPYRHGAVPTRAAKAQMDAYRIQHPVAVAVPDPNNLRFGGGVDGIGVTTGKPRVFLVFWGSGWGTSSTDVHGDVNFSGDPAGGAPQLQEMFRGLGTGGELWSGVMTQYCENVLAGADGCSPNDPHVGYPLGGALAGVFFDNTAVPASTTAHDIALEAVKAASHFGNTTASANRNAQYVILAPHGAHPDGFPNSGFCAWHDWNGDTRLDGGGAVSSAVGDVAFTAMPYVMDAGSNCGANYVNSSAAGGALDGYTMVEGHEYAETITDQNPAGGWTDAAAEENADKCQWIGTSPPGGAFNLVTGHGTFAEQGTWSNEANLGLGQCQTARPVVTLADPGQQSRTVNVWPGGIDMSVYAAGGIQPYTWSATGLPPGLSMDPTTGNITGAPTALGSFDTTVTVVDTERFSASTTFTFVVRPPLAVVPDVRGDMVAEAAAALQAAGFMVGTLRYAVSACGNVGLVLSQNPIAHASAFVGTAVDITIGTKPPHPCT